MHYQDESVKARWSRIGHCPGVSKMPVASTRHGMPLQQVGTLRPYIGAVEGKELGHYGSQLWVAV